MESKQGNYGIGTKEMDTENTSLCSKCDCTEFTLKGENIENSNSIILKLCCDNCGNIISAAQDNHPLETDYIIAKLEKCYNLEVGSFKVASMC